MGTKKQKLIDYNQSSILDAAKKLFLQNGIHKTTMDDISHAADCSKATIYVYFQSKDDIYYHIVLEYMTALRNSIESYLFDTKDYETAYFSFCARLVQFQSDYPMYFECILGNIPAEAKKMKELPVLQKIYDVGEEINVAVYKFLERGKHDGFIDTNINTQQATFIMWSGISGLISLYANKQSYLSESLGIQQEDFLKNGFTMLLRMIRKENAGHEH